MNVNTKDHFWQNLDKFILIFLFLVTLGVAVFMYRRGADTSAIQWIQGVVSQFLAALTAVLGSKQLSRAIDSLRGDDKHDVTSETKTTTTAVITATPKPVIE